MSYNVRLENFLDLQTYKPELPEERSFFKKFLLYCPEYGLTNCSALQMSTQNYTRLYQLSCCQVS